MGLENPTKLHNELIAAGIPVSMVSSDGRILNADATEEISQRPEVLAIIAIHDPTPVEAGPSIDERVEATELMLTMLMDEE